MCSYLKMMKQCWLVDPNNRPTFSQLVLTVESVMIPLANYLDFSTYYKKTQGGSFEAKEDDQETQKDDEDEDSSEQLTNQESA